MTQPVRDSRRPFPGSLSRHWPIYALILATPFGGSGCSTRLIRGRAERRIAQRLEDLIGPAEQYRVRVRRTKDAEIVVGRLRRIEIDARNVRAGNQIDVESLHLELNDLRYRAPPDESLSVGDSLLVIHLTESALNDYLSRQHPGSPHEVTLNDGTVTLKGSMRLLGVATPIETTGHLVIVDRKRLEYRADTARFSVDPIPGVGPEYVEKRLNPILDVDRLNLPLRIDLITVEPGRLVVRGAAYLPRPVRSR